MLLRDSSQVDDVLIFNILCSTTGLFIVFFFFFCLINLLVLVEELDYDYV